MQLEGKRAVLYWYNMMYVYLTAGNTREKHVNTKRIQATSPALMQRLILDVGA